jgi:hypothetical protein
MDYIRAQYCREKGCVKELYEYVYHGLRTCDVQQQSTEAIGHTQGLSQTPKFRLELTIKYMVRREESRDRPTHAVQLPSALGLILA